MDVTWNWQGSKEHSYTKEIDWKPDELWKFRAESAFNTYLRPVIGDGKVLIDHRMMLRTNLNMRLDAFIMSRAADQSIITDTTIGWTTELRLHAVASGGGLSVEAKTFDSFTHCQSRGVMDGIAKYLPGVTEKINEMVNGQLEPYKAAVRAAIVELAPWNGIAQTIKAALNGLGRFVFPGGGAFEMKGPIFSTAGDVLIGLTYKKGVDSN